MRATSLPFVTRFSLLLLLLCSPILEVSAVVIDIARETAQVTAHQLPPAPTPGPSVAHSSSQQLAIVNLDPQHHFRPHDLERRASQDDHDTSSNAKDKNVADDKREGGDEPPPPSDSSSQPPSTTSPPDSEQSQSSTSEKESTAQSESKSTATKSDASATSSSSAEPIGPLPTPFEVFLNNNFTSSTCPTFFNDFLKNDSVKNCHAVSLLLNTSNRFFQAGKSLAHISQVLDASCSVDYEDCSRKMSELAHQMTSKDACAADLRDENLQAVQTLDGLLSYKPLYRATCLKNPATDNYCYADAITNTSSPMDAVPYSLAIGTSLPSSGRPTCNECLQATLKIFSEDAMIKGQPLSKTYGPAASHINIGCGPSFASSVAVGSKDSSAHSTKVILRSKHGVTIIGISLIFSIGVPL